MEKRAYKSKPEIRKDDSGNEYIEGYGIVFGKESRMLGDFVEVIERSATDGADMSDIMGRYNHEVLIGRSTSGTLTYSIDEVGVRYSILVPKSATGQHVKELVERGDVNGSSFVFTIADGGQKWEERTDKTYKRTITKFEGIFDMGPVDRPAYPDTTAAKRSLNEFKEENKPNEALGRSANVLKKKLSLKRKLTK